MSITEKGVVKLKRPVDFEILDAYCDGEQDVGVNVAQRLERNRSYINTRLPQLNDYGLLTRVGPSERSGLYRITPEGVAALKLRDRYDDDDFEELVEARAEDITIRRPEIVDNSD